ncbi:MAG TPA: DUF2505 family protein [Acidimicrobiales bacterium]|nr:DUF2505 family protein [Acidimicrobiales bacterium]
MRFRIEQRFEAPLSAVEDALVDPAFLDRLAELPNLGRPELLRREEVGQIVHLDVRYAFAGQLSSAVTAVVDPARLTWVDSATVDRATHRSEHRILPEHYTGRLTCSYRTHLETDGAGTIRTAEGELRVHFPLVGGRVEKAIVAGMAEHAQLEARALDQWIEG